MEKIEEIVDFLFETGILAKTPRSGFYFLGSGNQSVAEHINRVVFIGYTMASIDHSVDQLKVITMCLLHDLAEGRTSDLNYVHQKYTQVDNSEIINDFKKKLPFGENIGEILEEYEARQTKEALLAKDADTLEWILSLKEELDTGNTKAESWIPSAVKRLKTEIAKVLAEKIIKTSSDRWWFADKNDSWWVSRNKG
ncbi:MAG: HD domain-containing protein [Patescibacteria group bacterium]|nr:HD domain-containing protein [Patescibacteria group bacterium]